jgi:hypothetical protein
MSATLSRRAVSRLSMFDAGRWLLLSLVFVFVGATQPSFFDICLQRDDTPNGKKKKGPVL